MDDHAEIATERLILRPLSLEHAVALYEIHGDAEAMRFWHAPPHKHPDETRAMIDELLSGPERVWVLCHRGGKDGIGLVYYLGNVGGPGMGYLLHRQYWGRGSCPRRCAARWNTVSRACVSIRSSCGSTRATSPRTG
jgi:RimJ/RimL family protein N-acetyltransferase